MRRTAAGVLAGALALSGAVAAATPAFAGPNFALERLAGDDRYETSARIATQFGAATSVILASGEQGRTPDALAANFLAGVRNAPVLLTRRDTTPPAILAAIRASGATRITVVGGRVAVSDLQIQTLRDAGFTVDRVAGEDRYETAAAIAVEGEEGESLTASNVGLVASGEVTIDALAGGPLAFAGRHPLFLVTRNGIPGATLAAMRSTGVTSVYILGGEARVGAAVADQLRTAGITIVDRLAGDDRSETSVEIANELIANHDFTDTTFNLASGLNEGVDALGGAALSGKERRVLLITNTATSAAPVTAFADDRSATLNAVGRIFGGTTVVAQTLETSVEAAGGAGGNFQTLNVQPQDAVTRTLVTDETTENTATDNRAYTVTGLDDALVYRITLVNAASIQGTGTSRTFLSSAIEGSTTAFAVNAGADIADIIRVNGGAPTFATGDETTAARSTTARPVNGNITFEIDGDAPGTVVPAVYVNGGPGGTATTGGTSTRLETSATAAGGFAAATETFGLGGPTTFVNPAAASQSVAAGRAIDTVNKAANQFDAGGFTFTYDANDSFRIEGVPVTLEEFEAALSRDDDFAATYAANAALTSTFDLDDVGPDAPAAIDPTSDGDDITVTVPVTANVDSVVLQRATVTGGTDEGTNGTVGTYVTVATLTPAAGATSVTFVDENLAAGLYRYQAAVVSDGQQSPFSPTGANETATAPGPDVTAPRATSTTRTTDGGLGGVLDAGDSFTVRADEALAAPVAGAIIRVTDRDTGSPTVADLVCGTNATCSLNAAAIPGSPTGPNAGAAAGTVLTVTVTAAPQIVQAGGVAGVQYPADITNTAGITDVAGNRLSLTTGTGVDLAIGEQP